MRLRAYIITSMFLCACSSVVDVTSPISGGFTQIDTMGKDLWKIDQNKWIYAQMKSEYYWNEDMPDSITLDFNQSPLDFFADLIADGDRFSYCEVNTNYRASSESMQGVDYQSYEDVTGNIIYRVLRGAEDSGRGCLYRGDWFTIKQGKPVKGYIAYGCFVEGVCLDKVFPNSVRDTLYHIGEQTIGYIVYNEFESYASFARSFVSLQNRGKVDNLVLDLRYNHGGYVDVCTRIASLLVPEKYLGEIFQMHKRNKIQTEKRIKKTGGTGLDTLLFYDNVQIRQINLDLSRLYVLTTSNSASASEALIHCLSPYMEVITIGTTTYGKNVGSVTISDDDYKYAITPITFQYLNSCGVGVSENGIEPDIEVEDDLDHMLGDLDESMLNAAIAHIEGQMPDTVKYKRKSTSSYPRLIGESTIQKRNNL